MTYTPWTVPGEMPTRADQFFEFFPTYEEAQEFTAELVRRIPERREELEKLVRSTPGYSDWVADYSVDSLESLGVWVRDHLPTRPPTPEDAPVITITNPDCPVPPEMIVAHMRSLPLPEFVVTDLGLAMVHDIAIYMSEVLRRSDPCWTWATCRDATKSYVNVMHHCPIISWRGQKRSGASSFLDAMNFICRILEKRESTNLLRDFVEINMENVLMLREKYGSKALRESTNKKPRRSRKNL